MTKDILQIDDFSLRLADNSLFVGLMSFTKTAYATAFSQETPAPTRLAAQITVFDGCYDRLNRAYRPVQTANETKLIHDADTKCDKLYMAMRQATEPQTRFDFDPTRQGQALMVWNNMNKYRIDVNENMQSENNKLQQLCEDFDTDAELAAAATAIGIADYVTQLKAAVAELRQLLTQRHDNRQDYGEMKAARAAMEPEWKLLCRLTNAYALVDDDEHRFDALITTMNRELDDLRKVIARKKGGSEDEDEEENGNENPNPNDNPGGNGGGGTTTDPTTPGGGGSDSGGGGSDSGGGSSDPNPDAGDGME